MYSQFYLPSFILITLLESGFSIYVALLLTGKKYMLPGGCQKEDNRQALIKFILCGLTMAVANELACDFLPQELASFAKFVAMILLFRFVYFESINKQPCKTWCAVLNILKSLRLPMLQTLVMAFILITPESLFVPLIMGHFHIPSLYELYKPENFKYLFICGSTDRLYQIFIIWSFWNVNIISLNIDDKVFKRLFFSVLSILVFIETLYTHYFSTCLPYISKVDMGVGFFGCIFIFILNFLLIQLMIKLIQYLNRRK